MTRCLNYLDTASPQLKHHPLLQRKTFWHLLYPLDIRRATVIHIVSSHISQKFHIICDAIIIYRFKTILIFFVNIYLFKLSSSSDMIRMSMCQHYIIGKRSQPGNQLFQSVIPTPVSMSNARSVPFNKNMAVIPASLITQVSFAISIT